MVQLLLPSCFGLIALATSPVPSLNCSVSCVRTCGLHHLKTHAHTCIDSRLSRLVTKQLSVIVASGPSSLEAQEVKVPISFHPFSVCCHLSVCFSFDLLEICVHCDKILFGLEISELSTKIMSHCVSFRCSFLIAAVFVWSHTYNNNKLLLM